MAGAGPRARHWLRGGRVPSQAGRRRARAATRPAGSRPGARQIERSTTHRTCRSDVSVPRRHLTGTGGPARPGKEPEHPGHAERHAERDVHAALKAQSGTRDPAPGRYGPSAPERPRALDPTRVGVPAALGWGLGPFRLGAGARMPLCGLRAGRGRACRSEASERHRIPWHTPLVLRPRASPDRRRGGGGAGAGMNGGIRRGSCAPTVSSSSRARRRQRQHAHQRCGRRLEMTGSLSRASLPTFKSPHS